MMRKKIFAVLLSCSLVVSLAACGTAATSTSSESGSAVSSSDASAEDLGAITSTLNLTDETYEGDIYNGSGSGSGTAMTGLAVNLTNSTLNGAITSTFAVHGIDYSEEAIEGLDALAAEYDDSFCQQGDEGSLDGDGGYGISYALLDEDGNVVTESSDAAYIQLLEYTMNEDWMQGQVINWAQEGATVEVTVDADSTWNVPTDSYITYLSVADGATVTVADGATLYVAGEALTGTVAAGTYGAEYVAAEESGDSDSAMMGGGDSSSSEEESADEEIPTIDTSNTVDLTVDGTTETVEPNYIGTLIPTFTSRTNDSMTIGMYIQANEIVSDYSALADQATVSDDGVTISGLELTAVGTGFTAVAVQGTEDTGSSTVNMNDVTLNISDDSDGTNVSDFTGLGACILASGASEDDHITMNIDNLDLTSTGFERDGIIVDDYADAIVTNSNIVVNGANPLTEAYDGYLSSANQAFMLSPPWILGIQGGARAANVLGDYSSLTVVDSYVEAGAWAVLSTDDCTSPVINVINSDLVIASGDAEYGIYGGADILGYDYNYGSGYGTYAIGEASEYFYGATFTGVTMATIMTGTGTIYYGPSYDGLTVSNGTGDEIYTYSGEGQDTVVNGVFGIMDHQGGTAQLDAGSVWNTEEAVILKKGVNESTYDITGATLNSASGVIFQLMDDDDGYGTSAFSSTGTTYDGTEWGMPTFPSGWSDANEAGRIQ